MSTTMKAVVIREPLGPEVLKIESLPVPSPKPGWVLILIKAFGLYAADAVGGEAASLAVAKKKHAAPQALHHRTITFAQQGRTSFDAPLQSRPERKPWLMAASR